MCIERATTDEPTGGGGSVGKGPSSPSAVRGRRALRMAVSPRLDAQEPGGGRGEGSGAGPWQRAEQSRLRLSYEEGGLGWDAGRLATCRRAATKQRRGEHPTKPRAWVR